MRFSLGPSLLLLLPAAAYTPESTAQTDAVAAKSFGILSRAVTDGSLKKELATRGVSQECTIANAAVRKE